MDTIIAPKAHLRSTAKSHPPGIGCNGRCIYDIYIYIIILLYGSLKPDSREPPRSCILEYFLSFENGIEIFYSIFYTSERLLCFSGEL